MKYKIGEFCRLLGIAPDTLRYYERCNLITTDKNPENKYRSFTSQDGIDIWNLLALRSMDMGCKDIQALATHGTFASQTAYITRRIDELEAEINRLSIKRTRLQTLSTLHELTHDIGTANMSNALPAHWALYVFGDIAKPCRTVELEIAKWAACFPFAYIALEIHQENILNEAGVFSLRLGLGVLDENVQVAQLAPKKPAVHTISRPGIRFVLRTKNVLALTCKDLEPMLELARKENIRFDGPITGRIICSDCQAADTEYVVALGVPTLPQ